MQVIGISLSICGDKTDAVPAGADCSSCPARQLMHGDHTDALCCCDSLARLMLPAGCYDGDVMGRLALEACKQMQSFTRGQSLSNLVSTCRTSCDCALCSPCERHAVLEVDCIVGCG